MSLRNFARFPALIVTLGVVTMTVSAQQRPPARPQPAPVMEFFEVYEQSILDMQPAQSNGRVTSRGLVESYLPRIHADVQAGPLLNSLVMINPLARDEADAMDRVFVDKKVRGPMHAIPVLIKDNY